MLTVWIVFVAILMIFLIILAVRNTQTYKECGHVILLIGELNAKDILANKRPEEYAWRWMLYDTISYDKTVFMFWKSVKSCYDFDWYNKPEIKED